jgi:type IV secretory pathway component VirB8
MESVYHNTVQLCCLFANKMAQVSLTEYEMLLYEQASKYVKQYLENQEAILRIERIDLNRKEKESIINFMQYMKENPIPDELKGEE